MKDRVEHSRVPSTTGGFTLLELLAAMGVLVLMVLMIGQLFIHASTIWDRGMHKTDMNTEVRAALQLIQRELSAAVVDDRIPLLLETNGGLGQNLFFVSAVADPDADGRELAEIGYYIDRSRDLEGDPKNTYSLYRAVNRGKANMGILQTNRWWQSPFWTPRGEWAEGDAPILQNVRSFEVTYWHFDPTTPDGVEAVDPDVHTFPPPALLKISIRVLNKQAAQRMEDLGWIPEDKDLYTFHTQVYIHNTHAAK